LACCKQIGCSLQSISALDISGLLLLSLESRCRGEAVRMHELWNGIRPGRTLFRILLVIAIVLEGLLSRFGE